MSITQVVGARRQPRPHVDPERFVAQWNELPSADRRRIRRLVRIGRPVDCRAEVPLAVAYADFQRSRIWFRLFWLWFVPAAVVAAGAAVSIHPVLLGVVIGAAGQALVVRRNLGRVRQVNAPLVASSA